MRMHRVRLCSLLLAGSLVMAACGTRVDDETFERLVFAEQRGGGTEAGELEDDLGDLDFSDFDGELEPEDGDVPAGAPGRPGQPDRPDQPGEPARPGADGEPAPADAPAGENTASDVGVTPTTIRVGNIHSRGGPLGPHQFSGMYYGANAYFQLLNARGGVNGRRIEFTFCDDREENAHNVRCAQQLVESDEVFAFVANSTRTYAGARFVAEQGIPDVAGYPIGSEYFRYPRFYAITGGPYPNDGDIGWNGKLYTNSAWQRWFVRDQGIRKAAVVHYNVPQSEAFARFFRDALRAEGAEVEVYEVNFVQPSFDAFVRDMESKGVEMIWDTMDQTGNANLCRSLDSQGYTERLRAKVSTAAAHGQAVGRTVSPECAAKQHAILLTRNYADTDHPTVREFQDTMRRLYGPQYMQDHLHQWAMEGWMAALWFTEAVRRMGPNVTREGLVAWFESLEDYQADGMFPPHTRTFQAINYDQTPTGPYCVGVARWDNNTGSFRTVAQIDQNCHNGRWIPWDPPQ